MKSAIAKLIITIMAAALLTEICYAQATPRRSSASHLRKIHARAFAQRIEKRFVKQPIDFPVHRII
jgi:hypothetical protein